MKVQFCRPVVTAHGAGFIVEEDHGFTWFVLPTKVCPLGPYGLASSEADARAQCEEALDKMKQS